MQVGSLLKRWLEELPDPLLNWDQQVELLSACKDEGCIEARIASLNDAVALVSGECLKNESVLNMCLTELATFFATF